MLTEQIGEPDGKHQAAIAYGSTNATNRSIAVA